MEGRLAKSRKHHFPFRRPIFHPFFRRVIFLFSLGISGQLFPSFAQPQVDSLAIKTEAQRLGINTFSMGTAGDDRYRLSANQILRANLGQYAVYNRALPSNRFITNNLWAGIYHQWRLGRRWILQNEAWQNSFFANQTRLAQGLARLHFLALEMPGNWLNIRAGAGLLNDKRQNFENSGPMAELGFDWVHQSQDSLLHLKATAEAMAASIQPRVNQKAFGMVQASRFFPESVRLGASLGYQYRKVEDYLASDIQSILSDSLFARLSLTYPLAKGLIFTTENDYQIPNRSFFYRNVESGKEVRNVFFHQNEWQTQNRLSFQNSRIKTSIGLEARQRVRDYGIIKRFSPSDPDYFVQLNLYNQRLKEEQIKDIQEQYYTYTTDLRWRMASRHLIRTATVAQLLRVDTRSDLNNQDRDEILYSAEAAHEWQVRQPFTLINKISASWRHLIFIEASQSSENFIDRIIRWEPGFRLRLPRLTWLGTYSIWATYQVRDFEAMADRNRSNRVLIFNQQAEYRLSTSWKLMADFLRRENRLSQFNWAHFSESPIDTVVIYDVSLRPQYQFREKESDWAFQLGYRMFWQVRKNRASLADPALGSRLIFLQNYIIQQGPQLKVAWNSGRRLRLKSECWFQWSSQFFRYKKTTEVYLGTSYSPEQLAFRDERFMPFFNVQATWLLNR